ncbi:MAG: hypothetical protein M5U28_49235 [Sandaracinaceae bacterium]|nr:hypothetical protein [Sandaracinaceae bacterium]
MLHALVDHRREVREARGAAQHGGRAREVPRVRIEERDARHEHRVELEGGQRGDALPAPRATDHRAALDREPERLLHPQRRGGAAREIPAQLRSVDDVEGAERRLDERVAGLGRERGDLQHRVARGAQPALGLAPRARREHERGVRARGARELEEREDALERGALGPVQILDGHHAARALEAQVEGAEQRRHPRARRPLGIERHRDALAGPPQLRHGARELDAILLGDPLDDGAREDRAGEVGDHGVALARAARRHRDPLAPRELHAVARLAQEA